MTHALVDVFFSCSSAIPPESGDRQMVTVSHTYKDFVPIVKD